MTGSKESNLLKELYSTLRNNLRKIIVYVALGTVVLFFFGYLLIKDEYTSSSTFIPRIESGLSSAPKLGGGLSSLTALAGIKIGDGSEDVFPPNLYNELLSDDAFCKEVLSSEVLLNDGSSISIGDYLLEDRSIINPINWLKDLIGLSKEKDIPAIFDSTINVNTEDERFIIEQFRDKCRITTSLTDGISYIEVKMPEAIVSAQVTKTLLGYLQKEILRYKMTKSRENLEFLILQLDEKENEFKNVQQQLAKFLERNVNLTSEVAKIELRNLESEYQLKFNLYNDLSLKVADAEFALQRNTPTIYLISKPNVPLRKSSIGYLSLLILCFLGTISLTIGLFHLKVLK